MCFEPYFADSGKHHADDTSSSSCCADTMTTMIKREAHTPTTDQSEDSGVDVSAGASFSNDSRGPYKRKRTDDEYGDGCPTPVKSNRIGDTATAAVLSVNMAVVASGKATTAGSMQVNCPPFRPWNSDESSSDVGLRLFHDIRNVDRILTLTQRHREPPTPSLLEPQPLDLTNGPRELATPAVVVTAYPTVNYTTGITKHSTLAVTTATTGDATAVTTANTTTRYSKNMSRARRIEANARERSRVHTISAAFDTLRTTIPSYSKNQKLSKLSTIRIASAYILTLSRLLDMDYSAEQNEPSVDECMSNITGIIHMEGKARKKKDDQ